MVDLLKGFPSTVLDHGSDVGAMLLQLEKEDGNMVQNSIARKCVQEALNLVTEIVLFHEQQSGGALSSYSWDNKLSSIFSKLSGPSVTKVDLSESAKATESTGTASASVAPSPKGTARNREAAKLP